MNWGKSIALGYISFVAFMIFMVIKTMGVQIDLVTPDYYEEEIHTNDLNIKLKNTKNSTQRLQFKTNEQSLIFDFSAWENAENISGQIKLFCPSDAKLDLVFDFVLNDSKIFVISSNKMSNKFYKVIADWSVDGVNYFEEFTFIKK